MSENIIKDLTDEVRSFADARDWHKFHTPKNLAMALAVKPSFHRNYSGESVVILDDLITTGATINEANRALTRGGFKVQAAATACVALRRLE